MKHQSINKNLILFQILLLIIMLLIAATACEPALTLEFENQTDQILTIYVQGVKIDEVAPRIKIKRDAAPIMDGKFLIEAKNAQEDIIYSKEFTLKELDELDFKIVISHTKNE